MGSATCSLCESDEPLCLYEPYLSNGDKKVVS